MEFQDIGEILTHPQYPVMGFVEVLFTLPRGLTQFVNGAGSKMGFMGSILGYCVLAAIYCVVAPCQIVLAGLLVLVRILAGKGDMSVNVTLLLIVAGVVMAAGYLIGFRELAGLASRVFGGR